MLTVLPTMEADSLDSCCTDPPYHLTSIVKRFGAEHSAPPKGNDAYMRASRGFMGRKWDGGDVAFRVETWREVYRVLKPGGYLVAFGGPRNAHRMVCAIEDAGFEIRDSISYLHDGALSGPLIWAFGSGFPKGLHVVHQCIRLALCQYSEHVPFAAQNSASIRVTFGEAKESIAVALVQILPEGAQALLTETDEEVALHVPTDMWPSGWMERIGLNMIWSWNGNSDDAWRNTSKCITSTISETTTDQKTFNWLIGLHTSRTTTQCSVILPNGSPWCALAAGSLLSDGKVNKNAIPIVSALGPASWNPVVKYKGFNIALKPAHEPICLARKPLSERTVAANVLRWGTGALNIDGCRVHGGDATGGDYTVKRLKPGATLEKTGGNWRPDDGIEYHGSMKPGRWPANVCHDGSAEVVAGFPDTGASPPVGSMGGGSNNHSIYGNFAGQRNANGHGDSGSAARYFYTAKADASDRLQSKHPTVKPVDLIRWLVRMVTPPGGTVLDCFAGSGTTGMAAMAEGFNAVLIEREAEYAEDIRRRVAHVEGTDTPLFSAGLP